MVAGYVQQNVAASALLLATTGAPSALLSRKSAKVLIQVKGGHLNFSKGVSSKVGGRDCRHCRGFRWADRICLAQQIFLKVAQRRRNGGAKATYRLRNGCGKGEAAKPRSRKSEATEGREVHNVVACCGLPWHGPLLGSV